MDAYETIVKDYRSWEEYLRDVREIPKGAITYTEGASESESFDWCGARNVGHALEIAERGWAEGGEFVQRISLPTVERLSETVDHTEIGADVTGAAFDVGEYLSGTPECWITPLNVASKPCVTIMLNVCISAGVSQKAIKMRGAAISALALTLQASGYAVRIYKGEVVPVGGYMPSDHAPRVCHRVCLTDEAGGPIDTDRLMFALAHPAAVRMLDFAIDTHLAGKPYGTLIGCVTLPFPEDLGWGKADFYLNSTHLDDANWEDEGSVAAWVKTQYESLRIKRVAE